MLNNRVGSPASTWWQYLLNLLNAAQGSICLLCYKVTLLACVQTGVHQKPKGLFWKADFHLISPCNVLVYEVVLPQVYYFVFPLLNTMRFLSAHFSLSMAAWHSMAATPSSWVSSANYLRVHSDPSSRSLMKMLNWTGPSIDPWSTLLVDCKPTISTLWDSHWAGFQATYCPLLQSAYQQLSYEHLAGDSVESLSEVQIQTISNALPSSTDFIIECYWVRQAWHPLGQTMLIAPDNLLNLHVPGNGFQD